MTEDELAEELIELAQRYWPGATIEGVEDPAGFTFEEDDVRFRVLVVPR